MPVRVKLRIRSQRGETVEAPALINSGYEAEKPELLLPLAAAMDLGLWPPERMGYEYAHTPVGMGRLYALGEVAEAKVIAEDKDTPSISVYVMVSEYEREILISDYLAGALGLAVEDFKEGLWRFNDEPLSKVRRSEKPRYWP
ncbi:MAG: hypothetical protein ACP5K1_03125 [Candidatus Bathyarchaeia archaeon]